METGYYGNAKLLLDTVLELVVESPVMPSVVEALVESGVQILAALERNRALSHSVPDQLGTDILILSRFCVVECRNRCSYKRNAVHGSCAHNGSGSNPGCGGFTNKSGCEAASGASGAGCNWTAQSSWRQQNARAGTLCHQSGGFYTLDHLRSNNDICQLK